VRNITTGEIYSFKLKPGDNSQGIAGQKTLEIRGMMRGEDRPGTVKGFNRTIDYGPWGGA